MFNALRLWFKSIEHSVNLAYYCKMTGINRGNLTTFLKGSNTVISYDKLNELRDFIITDLSDKIA